jgi:excisionase family DNA binding protein
LVWYVSLVVEEGWFMMEDLSKEKKWLSLKEASKLLGIHPVTLRIWADTEKIPCTRTPGGHRRFAEEDIAAFYENDRGRDDVSEVELKVKNSLERARFEFGRAGLKAEEWYDTFDSASRNRERELGQRLMTLLVLYATHDNEGQDTEQEILNEAREVGEQMGLYTTRMGFSLAETVRVFSTFESSAIDAAVPALARPGRIDEHDLMVHARAHQFMREVLFALLEAFPKGNARTG